MSATDRIEKRVKVFAGNDSGWPHQSRLIERYLRQDGAGSDGAKHLHALANAGLIRGERCGRERIGRLEPRRLAEVRAYLGQVSSAWDGAIERLRTFVEGH